MPDDYYTQADDGTPPDDEASPDESKSEDSNTTLVPNSFFSGEDKEVGSICKIRIVHKFDDESEIAYEGHQESESTMDNADSKIDEMASSEE